MKTLFVAIFVTTCLAKFIKSEEIDIKCNQNYCEEYKAAGKCEAADANCKKNPNSVHFPYPDTCNCCEYCLKNLRENDYCTQGRVGTISPMEICGPGLECMKTDWDRAKCQKIKSECTKAQDVYDKRKEEGSLGMTEIRAQCDDDGFFKPSHCIPGSLCYCLSPTGERIFGELPYLAYENQEKMTCGCSINAWKAENTLDSKQKISVARCTEYGTYDQLQCMTSPNSTCLCVNAVSGMPISETSVVEEKDIRDNNPSCFDTNRHVPGKYMTDCEAELEKYYEYVAAKERGDMPLLQVEKPSCQPDGKFSRIQLTESKIKMCVDPNGKQIDAYEATIGTQEEKTMNCNCARTRWLLANAGVTELPSCCPNGNFEAWQCRRNECFCVDPNHNQVGLEVDVKDITKLDCYQSNAGKAC